MLNLILTSSWSVSIKLPLRAWCWPSWCNEGGWASFQVGPLVTEFAV